MRRTAVIIATIATAASLAACSSSESENDADPTVQTDPVPSSSSDDTGSASSGDALAAPDGPAPTDSYPDAKAACTSVSPEQITEILGAAGEATGSGSKCIVDVAANKEVTVEISELTSQGYDDIDDYIETHSTGSSSIAVDGLGDAAYVSTVLGELTMVVGDQFVEVDVVLDDKSGLADPTRDWSAVHEAAIKIGATVADRAPIPTS